MKKICRYCRKIYDMNEICCPECGAFEADPYTEDKTPVRPVIENTARCEAQHFSENPAAAKPAAPEKPARKAPAANSLFDSFKMMSMYDGEPTVGVARATGTLDIYYDRIEFDKKLGNALGSSFGLLGMAVARKNAQKSGNLVLYFSQLTGVSEGKYMGCMPMLVLTRRDGSKISFAGTFSGATLRSIVEHIRYYIG